MALTPSIALLFLVVFAVTLAAPTEQDTDVVVHESRCPSNNLLGHLHCRRRVCLPEELTLLCNNDGQCPTSYKCCRPTCSCQVKCVRALPELPQN